jgi:hypothetical protein
VTGAAADRAGPWLRAEQGLAVAAAEQEDEALQAIAELGRP